MAKKILMLVGDYVEDYEVMVPFQALTMLGYAVDAVCPDKKAGEFVRTSTGKPIAAICHGPLVLVTAGVLQGKSCSAYPACGPDVTCSGGKYADIALDKAHVDGNLVTAPAWPAHPDWIAKFAALLGAKITI